MRKLEFEIIETIEKWEKDELQAHEIFTNAEKIAENTKDLYMSLPIKKTSQGWILVMDDKKRVWSAIPAHILEKFADMHHEWVTKEDIPAMRKFLQAHEDDSIEAWEEWDRYWKNLDWDKRKEEARRIGWPPYIVLDD